MQSARKKRRKKKSRETQSQRRTQVKEGAKEEWRRKRDEQKTRRSLDAFLNANPEPSSPSMAVIRTPSIATITAVEACAALDGLRERNRKMNTPRRQKAEESDDSSSDDERQALADITNSAAISLTTPQPSPLSFSSPSPSAAVARADSLSSVSSAVSTGSTNPSPSSSSSSIPPPSTPAAKLIHPQGLMSTAVSMTSKQKMKEMKRMIGEESAAAVRESYEMRKEERKVVQTAGEVLNEMKELAPVLKQYMLWCMRKDEKGKENSQ
jgi:hypothetical protein